MAQIVRPLLSTWSPSVAHGTLCQVVKSGVPRHLIPVARTAELEGELVRRDAA